MLARAQRMTSGGDFSTVIRQGRRAGSNLLVVHALHRSGTSTSQQVGLIVPNTVGNSVSRNRVKRQLRHAVRPLLSGVPEVSALVIRANPGASQATYAELVADLGRLVERSLSKASRA